MQYLFVLCSGTDPESGWGAYSPIMSLTTTFLLSKLLTGSISEKQIFTIFLGTSPRPGSKNMLYMLSVIHK